jgi:hypothetical protein
MGSSCNSIEFKNKKEAANYFGVTDTTITNWLKISPNKPEGRKGIKVILNGISFNSISAAAKYFDIGWTAASNRIKKELTNGN